MEGRDRFQPHPKKPLPAPESYESASCGPNPERPGLVAIGTVIEPVPVTGLAANFSPMPRIAPPPLGREILGAANGVPSFGCVLVSPFCLLGSSMDPPLQKISLAISDPETDQLLRRFCHQSQL